MGNANSKIGILLVDQGLDVPEIQDTPWSKYTRNRRAPDFLPILGYNETPSDYNIVSTSRGEQAVDAQTFPPKRPCKGHQ